MSILITMYSWLCEFELCSSVPGMSCLFLICSMLLYLAYKFCTSRDPKPIFGVYTQHSKWFPFKYSLFLFIYYVRAYLARYFKDVNKPSDESLDSPQPLIDHIKAFDAVFFIGANTQGYYFAMGAERRQSGVVNGLFYLVVPGQGLLCSSRLPDTVLLDGKPNQFGAEGILMSPIEPMRKWKLKYKGKMWCKTEPGRVFHVNFTADWCSKFDYFNYDTDLHPKAVARAIARESWTKEYFESLQSAHQSRYEQMGQVTAKLELEGTRLEFSSQSFRDHGYGGKRDWSLMHRYAFFHMFLENGVMAAVGVVSQPCTVSSMETGYVYQADGTIHSVEWCDFQLYQHGERGHPPRDHAFRFKAGGLVYTVQVLVQHENTHYVGWNWEARMVERFVKYCVNGVSGQGVSEFHYKNSEGRPADVNATDPQWFQTLRQQYIYS